ncbi:MAG: OmpA family protein [Ferruginibacter sp.]
MICQKAAAQNLFANGSFEVFNNCTEYHADCAPEAWFNIPLGNLKANSFNPKAIMGKYVLTVPVENLLDPNKRIYVYSMLACPLQAGKKYTLSLFLNSAGLPFSHLDFYFSAQQPLLTNFKPLEISADIVISEANIIGDFKQWRIVEYQYTARGDERFCTIGNFSDEAMNYDLSRKMDEDGNIFYFIDDIKLTPPPGTLQCNQYVANIRKMYDQNMRHTNDVLIDKDTPVMATGPIFINDTITLPAVLFEVNSVSIKPAFKKMLDSIAIGFTAKKISKLEIFGHTDNSGTRLANQQLSAERAASIKSYLDSKLPQLSGNIFSFGKGQDFPIADNNTKAGKEKNRRVEIIVTRVITKNN